jgi:hypothetical protein
VGRPGAKIEASVVGVIDAPFVTSRLRFLGRGDDLAIVTFLEEL